jgi:hypothetical protein
MADPVSAGRRKCGVSAPKNARVVRPFRMLGREGEIDMAKGQEKKATNNKPKLSVKEKKAKKKEKAGSK